MHNKRIKGDARTSRALCGRYVNQYLNHEGMGVMEGWESWRWVK